MQLIQYDSRQNRDGYVSPAISLVPTCILSFVVTACINLQLTYFPRTSGGWQVIYHLREVFQTTALTPVYEFVAVFALIQYVRSRVTKQSPVYLIPAALLAFFMVEGHYFETENAVDFFHDENLFVLLSLLYFGGYCFVYYYAFLVSIDYRVS